jgi:hypothetical protein
MGSRVRDAFRPAIVFTSGINTKSYWKQAMEGNMPMIWYPIALLE